jgi:hypothetical protein
MELYTCYNKPPLNVCILHYMMQIGVSIKEKSKAGGGVQPDPIFIY